MKRILLLLFTAGLSASAFAQPKLSPTQQAATDLFKSGKADEAIPLFKKALTENPKDAYSLNALDVIYFQAGRYTEVYECASKGIIATNGGLPFVSMKAEAAYQLHKYPEAIKLVDDYNKKNSPDARLLFVKGKCLEANGDAQAAIVSYTAAMTADPSYAEPFLARGNYLSGLGRLAPAIKDYDQFITLSPEDPEGYNMRGIAKYKNGDFAAAVADYSKAIELKPGYAQAIANRAMAKRDNGDLYTALVDFEAAIKLLPNDDTYYFEEAITYDRLKAFAQAVPLINQAIIIQPNKSVYYVEQSRLLLQFEYYDQAKTAAESAIRLSPENPEGYLMKSVALSNAEKWPEALVAINIGIAKNETYYLFYMQRANIYRHQGNNALAESDDAKAKNLASKL